MPIYKSKNSKIPSNYRPISVLHSLSKIMEKLVKCRIIKYLNKENIMCKQQFGFRAGQSTSDAILELTDKCASNLDKRMYTIAVFWT